MAGSYKHCVTDDGQLRTKSFIDLIENIDDAWEATEEMYGMIWLLANGNEDRVADAHRRFEEGLALSPGPEARR